MNQYKSVEFAYPTSPNAKSLGFNKSGCWTVEIRKGNSAPKAVNGFPKKEDAVTYAESLSLEWCPIYLRAKEICGEK